MPRFVIRVPHQAPRGGLWRHPLVKFTLPPKSTVSSLLFTSPESTNAAYIVEAVTRGDRTLVLTFSFEEPGFESGWYDSYKHNIYTQCHYCGRRKQLIDVILCLPIRRTSFSGKSLFVNIQRYVERGRIQNRDHERTTGPVCKNIFSVFLSNFMYSCTCVLEFKLIDRFS